MANYVGRKVCLVVCTAALAGCGKSGATDSATTDAAVQPAAVEQASAAAVADPTPAVNAAASPAYSPTASQTKKLRYRFEPNKAYHYNITSEMELGERVVVTSALCSYTTLPPKGQAANSNEPLKATGTAFVVHADGYLMTCAHVIEDYEKIEVAIGGKTYLGHAIEIDEVLDIALIKIDARALPVMPLANSDGVQVGQEVRAIGFPLSDVLGSSLKATRGTVSGIDESEDGKRFQIDASVNGGNSGGPLVTEGGQVVGVVNAKLTGSAISNVGFAVPVNFAKRMMTGKNVKFAAGAADPRMEGPALVQKVSPSVALVTVTMDRAAVAGVQTLKTDGQVGNGERTKSMATGQYSKSPNYTFFGRNKPMQVEVDNRGQVVDLTGGDPPKMMSAGPVPLVIFEPLPADGRTKWHLHSEYTMEVEVEDEKPAQDRGRPFAAGGTGPDRFGPSGFGPSGFGSDSFGRGGFGPRGSMGSRFGSSGMRPEQPVTKRTRKIPIVEDTYYNIESTSGDLAMIVKKYEMQSKDTDSKASKLQMTGEGRIAFDVKLGLPKKMDYKGEMNIVQGPISIKFPFTLTYEQTEGKPATPPAVAAVTRPAEAPAATPAASPAAATTTPRPDVPATGAAPAPQAGFPARAARPAPGGPEKEFVPVASRGGKLSVRASGTARREPPEQAFDGDRKTTWGAGGWPIQWIEADLMQPTSLGIKLYVAQLPASETEHEVWISDKPLGNERPDGKLAHTFRGATKGDDLLEFKFPAGTTARYVQIRTMQSRSWVAWQEIDIQTK